ncbi:MAG: hypothetical protein PHE43_04655 [Candidatus Nanoarchaeia archaeon]|nr:hypothetical protein [Candidatus Nanoarchaeia archaeon]
MPHEKKMITELTAKDCLRFATATNKNWEEFRYKPTKFVDDKIWAIQEPGLIMKIVDYVLNNNSDILTSKNPNAYNVIIGKINELSNKRISPNLIKYALELRGIKWKKKKK